MHGVIIEIGCLDSGGRGGGGKTNTSAVKEVGSSLKLHDEHVTVIEEGPRAKLAKVDDDFGVNQENKEAVKVGTYTNLKTSSLADET